jgi:Rps23 Pro-64 3,4-dihydroxylase Tpa1-like proline 4-hydroxylase
LVGRVRSVLPDVCAALGSRIFAPARFETELVAHGDGAFFARHTDTIVKSKARRSHRMISMVYYFHSAPKAFTGASCVSTR